MKKTAIILLTVLIAGMFVACNQDVTVDAQVYANMEAGTFVLNGQNYATLQAAIDALSSKAIGQNDDVIYLTRDASGPGAVIDGVQGVKIDFGSSTYTFTNVTATQGSTEGTFGLTIKGGSSVTLAGTKAINLFDSTSGLTMVYVEGATTSLAVEQAPQMKVADDQFVFWAANGATLTIGGQTTMTGGLAATGTTEKTPLISVNDEAKATVSNMKLEAASVVPNSSQAMTVSTLEASAESKIINSGEGGISVTTDNSGSGTYTVQNTSSSSETTVKVGNETIAQDKAKEKTSDGTWSDKTPSVAMVGAEGYETLALAIASGNGKTVKLVADVNEGVTVDSGKTITLDLNGKTIGKTDAQTINNSGTLNIENSNETLGYVNNTDEGFGAGTTKIYAGMFSIDPREKVVEYYTATKNSDGKWVVVEAEVSITQGDSTIYRTLVDFRDEWNNGEYYNATSITVNLLKDVDISNTPWMPIGNRAHPFFGSFFGNGKTINGLANRGYSIASDDMFTTDTTQIDGAAYGFFGVIGKAAIDDKPAKDVTISNFSLSEVNLENIENNMCGAVVGADMNAAKVALRNYSGNITITDVTVSGEVIEAADSVGGIMGKAYTTGSVIITNCITDIRLEAGNARKLAGILGFASGPSEVFIKDNTVKQDVVLGGIDASKAVTASRGSIDMTVNTANKVGKNYVFGDSVNTVTGKMIVGSTEYKHPYFLSYSFDENTGKATGVTYTYIKNDTTGYDYLANYLILFNDGTTVNGLKHDAFYNSGVYPDAVDCFGTVVMNNCAVNVYNAESGASLTLYNCEGQRVHTYNKFAQSANSVGTGKVYISGGRYTGDSSGTQNCLSSTVQGSSANGRNNITVYSGSFADGYITTCLPGSDRSDFLGGTNSSYSCTKEGVTYTVVRQGSSNCWDVTNNAPTGSDVIVYNDNN